MEHLVGFCIESCFYLFGVGIFQVIPFGTIVALFAVPIWLLKGRSRYITFMLRFIAFNLLLLVWGCFGDYAWSILAWNRLYTACDRVIDWVPYTLFSPAVYSYACSPEERGHLLGNATDAQLFQLWLLLAVATWILSLLSFLLLCRYSHFLRAVLDFVMNDN